MRQVEQEQLSEKNSLQKNAPSSPEQRHLTQSVARSKSRILIWAFLEYLLQLLLLKVHRKQVPELRQMSESECGLACLAMILGYYGRKTSISELRTQYEVGRDGISALGIVKAARAYGMRVRAVSLQQNDFRFVKLPAIVHWEFNHFLIVERWSRKFVNVVDPAMGRYRLTYDEFDAGFTGVVLTFEPSATFDRRATPSARTFRTYIQQYFRLTPATILQLLLASVLLEVFGLLLPFISKLVIDQILPFKMSNLIGILGAGILILFLSQTITTLVRSLLLVYLQNRIDIHMMLGFVERLLALPYSFFEQRSSGDLLTRLSSNTTLRDILSNQLLSTLLDGSLVIVYLIILLWQSLPFGLLTLTIGVIQILLLLASNRPIRNLASRELAAQGKTQGYLTEVLTGIATLKGSGAEQRAFERWSNLFFDQLNISMRYSYLSATLTTVMNAIRSSAPLALLWIGAIQVLNGTLTLGTMIALSALAGAFLGPLTALIGSGQQLQLVGAHLERIADVTEAEPEQKGQAAQGTPLLTGNIHLENVSFRYATEAPEVLKELNLTVDAGQKIAIVGPSGSGKSTLGKLLLGLYVPTEGTIAYDNIPLQHLNYQEVRQQFGVVLQEASLFSGSILSNITLNDPTIDKERVVQAARIAAIHEDISNMPMGYETLVAEGGSALSGGQRQRLSIARAIAHKPALLLLDEATSHLDVATEKKVAQHLQALACTQIIIAHRLSTIRDADAILVLFQGMIVEQGSHEELLQRNGYYARLMRQQMGSSNAPQVEEKMPVDDMEQVTERRTRARIESFLMSKSEPTEQATSTIDRAPTPSVPPQEVQTQVVPVPLQAYSRSSRKSRSLALGFITVLLLSMILGTSLWLLPAVYHPAKITLPTLTGQHTATLGPTPSSTILSTSATSFPALAKLYNGTISDLPESITAGMILSNIQQQQGSVSGYFSGIPKNATSNSMPQHGPFIGTITSAKGVRFVVTSDTGHTNYAFDGVIHADGTIAGTYCSLSSSSEKCSNYGLWSIYPMK